MKFQAWRMISGTLAGSCFVALTQIITRDKLSSSLHYAVLCFAVAIPTLAAYILYPPTFERQRSAGWPLAYCVFHLGYLAVVLTALLGLSLLFFSIGWSAVILFCLGCFIAHRIMATGSANKAGVDGFR
jgi:hypothetical protein